MTVTVASVPESHIRSSLGAGLLTYFLMFTTPSTVEFDRIPTAAFI